MTEDNHKDIKDKLNYFIKMKKIPNIIFHGPCGSGKKTIVETFMNDIYDHDKVKIKNYSLIVNCSHGKGIKFIREELKFFAKTNINSEKGNVFKTIILNNSDKLTIDAQSALRRCIELFSHSTRFFMIVEDKYKLMKPILSRFCEIFVYEPIINNKITNFYKYNLENTYNMKKNNLNKTQWLKKQLSFIDKNNIELNELRSLSIRIYNNAYSALDLIDLLHKIRMNNSVHYFNFMSYFNKIKKEIRCEKSLMLFILIFMYCPTSDKLYNDGN